MISSTGAEIYRQAKAKKNNPHASEESSIQEDSEENDDDREELNDSNMTQFDERTGEKKKKKLKPSGIVYQTHIDPDATSEEEITSTRSAKSKQKGKKKSPLLKIDSILKISPEEFEERKKKLEEARAKKKEKEAKLKELNKNFDRKDKRETIRFL